MEIQLLRKWPRPNYIIGRMLIDGQFVCHTMEPPYTAAHPCIPSGTYEVEMYPSTKFKALRPIVKNVPKRSGILIHEGNFPRDTMGCILVGRNDRVGHLSGSRNALSDIMYRISHSDKTTITIKDCF